MKHKWMFIGMILLTLGIAFFFSLIQNTITLTRHHQHQAVEAIEYEDDTSKLPIIKIDTKETKIPGTPIVDANGITIGYEVSEQNEKMSKASLSLVNHETKGNKQTDRATFQSDIQIRYRGNSSRHFAKKGYLIRLIDEQGQERKEALLGMSAHNEWALHGPFLDKTLMRNYLCMNIIGQVMPFTPDVRFVQVYVDDEYQGLYLMEETITQGEGRVNIAKVEDGDRHISYILRMDENPQDIRSLHTLDKYTFMSEEHTSLSVVYPGTNRMSEAWKEYIEQDISAFEKALFSYDFQDPEKGYRAYIDVESFVDYYIFMEFFGVKDFGLRSTYVYKDVKGKLCMGPVWDFNNTMDNFFQKQPDTGIQFVETIWFRSLLKDEYFVNKVIHRYHDLRKTVLQEEYLLQYIDEVQSFLGQEIERNYEKWGYSFDASQVAENEKLIPDERNLTSYEAAIEQMKSFLQVRGQWLDEHIETLYQYAHESKNKDVLLK